LVGSSGTSRWRRAGRRTPAGEALTEDSFVAAIDRVSDAGRRACSAIEAALGALDAGREARQSGATLAQVVDLLMSGGGREVRVGSAKALVDYERAIAAMRALVVRALVDEEGMSFTDVAARLRISRQAAAGSVQDDPAGHRTARKWS
jgi:hypothetical protein